MDNEPTNSSTASGEANATAVDVQSQTTTDPTLSQVAPVGVPIEINATKSEFKEAVGDVCRFYGLHNYGIDADSFAEALMTRLRQGHMEPPVAASGGGEGGSSLAAHADIP